MGAGVDAGFGPRVRLELEEELRVGADAGYDQLHTQLGLSWRPMRPVRVGALYRLILLDDETRHRVGAEGEALGRAGRLRFGYRLRLQATTRPGDDTQLLVRNRGKVAVRASARVRPFVALELHHQIDPNAEFREFRFQLGVDWELQKKVDLTASYLYQEEANVGNPERNHVLALALVYHFGDLRAAEDTSAPGD
jgi:hypothetical protein